MMNEMLLFEERWKPEYQEENNKNQQKTWPT